MRSYAVESVLLTAILVLLALAPLPGCENEASGPDHAEPVLKIWLGSYVESEGEDRGAVMMDIMTEGSRVSSEILVESRLEEDPDLHLFLVGTIRGDDITLSLDTDRIPYAFEFDMQLTLGPGGALSGSFYYSVLDMAADIECSEIPWVYAAADTVFGVDFSILGIAYDGEHFWLSTFGKDYVLMDPATVLVDTIAVMYDGMHWTSDALTSDGDLLWGHLPLSVSEGGVVSSESYCIEFTRAGDITRMFRVRHRISGLAWDGEGLWSLSTRSDSLYMVDPDGAIIGAVAVGVPDMSDIEFGGGAFWAVGWYMRRIYRISPSGEVLTVYRFPEEYRLGIPGGLVFDGSSHWCVFNQGFDEAMIYRLSLE